MTSILFLLLILAPCALAKNPDHWQSQIMFGEMCAVVWISYQAFRRVHWSAALAFMYFGAYAAYAQFATTRFEIPGINVQEELNTATARSLAFLLCATTPFIFTSSKSLSKWLNAFYAFAGINASFMLMHVVLKESATGLIGMDSVDGSFLAILLPLVIFSGQSITKQQKGLVITLMVLAIFFARSSTAYATVCLEFIAYLFLRLRESVKNIIFILICGGLMIPAGRLYLGSEFLNPNGRQSILLMSWEIFKKYSHYLLGLGTGSFIVLIRELQGRNVRAFAWMHNEPAQIIFEQGIIGLILIALVYFFMCRETFKCAPVFLTVLAAGFVSFLQPCFRYFPFAIFMAFLVRLSFEKLTSEKGDLLCSES